MDITAQSGHYNFMLMLELGGHYEWLINQGKYYNVTSAFGRLLLQQVANGTNEAVQDLVALSEAVVAGSSGVAARSQPQN